MTVLSLALALPLIMAAGLMIYVALIGLPSDEFNGEYGDGL